MSDELSLDDPVGQSLRGHHEHLARSVGNAISYAEGLATFAAVPIDFTPTDWRDPGARVWPGSWSIDWPRTFSTAASVRFCLCAGTTVLPSGWTAVCTHPSAAG